MIRYVDYKFRPQYCSYAYNALDTEYLRFCEDIEAIFAKPELEKMPLIDPDRAKPYGSWTQTKELPVLPLSPEKEGVAYACLQKIAEQVLISDRAVAKFTFLFLL